MSQLTSSSISLQAKLKNNLWAKLELELQFEQAELKLGMTQAPLASFTPLVLNIPKVIHGHNILDKLELDWSYI